jgi:succinoglycan biosynthesis transport protein ExoP
VIPNRPTALADYLRILRHRKWIVAIAFAAAVSAAVLVSMTQRPLYRATAQVLINRANIVSSITGVTDPSMLGNDPTRFIATQSDVARSLGLARQVVAAAGVPGLTARQLLAASSVTPATNADVLNVAVSSPRTTDAIRLANTYAQQYTAFKTNLDTAHINKALATLKSRIASMSKSGVPPTSPSYATLLQYESQLETIAPLLANNTQVLAQADGTVKIRPRPKRNALLGGLIGIVVGIGLAFLAEALERRIRSSSEAEAALGLPLLARVPAPPRSVRKAGRPVMLAKPVAPEAEPYRRLRTNLEFVNLDHRARKIMVTSATGREGKSTTIANLGVAFARAGRKVALVDLDLRKPALHQLFGIAPAPGITDVVLKHVELPDALRTIDIARRTATLDSSLHPTLSQRALAETADITAMLSNGRAVSQGMLKVLPAGTMIADAGEVIDDDGLVPILNTLAEQFDYVLLDAPPFLAFGDAPALSARVDAIVVVTRLGVVSVAQLRDLEHQLETCQAERLGFVAAGAEVERYEKADYYHAMAKAERGKQPTPK